MLIHGAVRRPVANVARRQADRKSTRLNSIHGYISYAVFCLKKKKWSLPLLPRVGLHREWREENERYHRYGSASGRNIPNSHRFDQSLSGTIVHLFSDFGGVA